MKKIIAMLLCVALVASMGIAAFADVGIAKAGVSTTKELYDKLVADASAPADAITAYAKGLSAAKTAANAAKSDLAKLIGSVKNAAQTAQYVALEAYYDAAVTAYENAVAKAINEYLAGVAFDISTTSYVFAD